MIKNIPKRRFKGFNDEWEEKKLGEIGVFTSSGVDKKINKNHEEVYLLNYMDVYNRINLNNINKKRLMKVTATKEQLLKNDILKNDIFFTPSSETPDDIGRVMVIEETLKNVVYSYHLMRFRPNSNVFHSTFPNYSFETTCFRKNLILNSQGVQRYVLNKDSFENLISFIPSLLEQQKIGDFFQKLDKQISLYDKKINKLKDLKNSYLNKMFPKENALYPELRFEGFNDEWKEKRFGEIFKVSQGLQIPIEQRYTSPAIKRYFYITNEFLKDSFSTKYYIENPLKNVLCTKDDLLMTRTGNTGVVITNTEGCFHNNFFKIKYEKHVYIKEFLYYFLSSPDLKQILLDNAGSSTISDLSHSSFNSISKKFPLLPEQQKIGSFFSKLDTLINLYENKYKKLKDLKKAYLNEMFANK